MILKENYTAEHIFDLQKKTGADPAIIERMIFAFGLLEAISRVGLQFIFKGGTSLLLILKNPKRFSTDIDIIVKKGTNIDSYIQEAGKIFPFVRVEENYRKRFLSIEKRHFRFIFISPITNKEINVLLDVVFENDPYTDIYVQPIKKSFLLTKDKDFLVNVPNKNCILGDKLTAFAPHTIGVPLGIGKELEIIKQLYDCYVLIQEMDDFAKVSKTYKKVASIEISYRNLSISSNECLIDTITSCICIIGRGSIRTEEYKQYSSGVAAIRGHVFKERINGENIAAYTCEVMYLATCILTKQEFFERITNPEDYRNIKLDLKGIRKLGGIRNTNLLAYAYMIKSFQLLQENGFYTESVI